MVISGTEALFDVLSLDEETVTESLRKTTLDAVMNLAKNQKMAAMLINRFDLMNIIDLTRCKVRRIMLIILNEYLYKARFILSFMYSFLF